MCVSAKDCKKTPTARILEV